MDKIKLCVCGAKAITEIIVAPHITLYIVRCTKCNERTSFHKTRINALAAWNTRKEERNEEDR